MKKLILLAAITLLTLSACTSAEEKAIEDATPAPETSNIAAVDPSSPAPVLHEIMEKCGNPSFAKFVDNDTTLLVQIKDAAEAGDLSDQRCITGSLDTPESIKEKINSTDFLDGRQEASWGNFSAWWKMDMTEGLTFSITEK